MRRIEITVSLALAVSALGCSSEGTPNTTGTGGSSASGATGGAGATGGSPTTGGMGPVTGGSAGSGAGASPVTGGASGAGGAGGAAAGMSGASGASGVAGLAAGASGAGPAGAGGMSGAAGDAGTGGVSGGGTAGASGSAGAAGSSAGTAGSPPICDDCEVPAFPGADGPAGGISGGRGGDVYHVTRLDTDFQDMTPGTLRYGLSNLTGPRTIVFDVSGVFRLGRTAVSGWDSNGNGWDTASRLNLPADVTVAGQTAPGPVVIAGGSLRPGETNIILRHVLIAPGYGNRNFDEPEMDPAPGDFPDSYVFDAIDISGQRVMIDHVTTIYATDETISMNEEASEITIQYSIIAQGQNYPQADAESSGVRYTGHALGSLLQAGSNATVGVHHNLYAHLKGRMPRVGTETDALSNPSVGAFNDFRNNVFYNWLGTAGTGASGQPSQNNFIGNFYLAGDGGDDASGNESTAITQASGGTSIFNGSDSTNTKVYQRDNLKDTNRDSDANDGVALTNSDFSSSAIQGSAFTQPAYTGLTETPAEAFENVLSNAGSRQFARGSIESRLVAETRAGTGRIVAWADDPFNSSSSEGTEWRALVATPMMARPSGFDTDMDGMPDAWETTNGTNPAAADNNGDLDQDGYSNLEEYLNELAAWPAPAVLAFVGQGTARYAEIRNWRLSNRSGKPHPTAVWQPSRYDVARVFAGTAVVDAPGQHAGRLDVDADGGAAAVLALRAGWLEVHRQASVGRAGVLELHDGLLRVRGDASFAGLLRVSLREGGAIRVDGVAEIGGVLELDGGSLAPGASKTLLVARGGVTGRFESVPLGYEVLVSGSRVVLWRTPAPRRFSEGVCSLADGAPDRLTSG